MWKRAAGGDAPSQPRRVTDVTNHTKLVSLTSYTGFPLTSGGVFTSFYATDTNLKANSYLTVIGTLGTVSCLFFKPQFSLANYYREFLFWVLPSLHH
jgi:hypothetical protein